MEAQTAAPQTVTPQASSAPPDADGARYAELAKEFGDQQPAVATPDPAPVQPPAAVKVEDKKPDPLPYEELDKRYRNLQGALGEARGETRSLKQSMEQIAQDNARMQQFLARIAREQPAHDEDPYLAPVQRQVQTLAAQQRDLIEATRQQQQVLERQRQMEMLTTSVSTSEAQFARSNPDYFEAVDHLKQGRLQEYEVMYPDGHPQAETHAINSGFRTAAELRNALLMQDVRTIAAHANQMGMTPAEMAYRLAKQRGYAARQTPSPAAAVPLAPSLAANVQPAAPSRIDTIRQGQQAASSLSTGPAAASTESAWPSHAELARMYLDDPDKAEAVIAKMQRAGALN